MGDRNNGILIGSLAAFNHVDEASDGWIVRTQSA